MDVLVADIDLVVRKGVQSVLLSTPVEVIPPILDEIGQVAVIDAGLPSLTRRCRGDPCFGQPPAEIGPGCL
jgi:hypothetical protein